MGLFSLRKNNKGKSKSKEKRVLLSHKDFEDLTSGKIVNKGGVKIALSDIGFENMSSIISKNYYSSKYNN